MKQIKQFIGKIMGHQLTKNSSVVFVGSMTANFMAYLYHLVVGRILGPEQYGELAALLSLFYILNVPSTVLQTVLVKFFSQFKAKNEYSQAKTLFVLATKKIILGEVFVLLISVWFFGSIVNFLHISSPNYVLWLYLIFATYFLSTINASAIQGFQMFTHSTIYANLGMLFRLLISGALALWGVGWALIGNIVSNAITYIMMFLPLRFLLRKKSDDKLLLSTSRVVGLSSVALGATFGMVMLYSADVVMVKHFFPAVQAGIYSSLSVLGKIIFFASSAVIFVMFPTLSERKEQQKNHQVIVWFALGAVGIISMVLSVLYFTFPRLVVDLLFGKAYEAATPLVGVFGLFIAFYSLANVLTSICIALELNKVWILTLGAAIAQVILITFFHASLLSVIFINLITCAVLCVSLFAYYQYATQKLIS